MKLIATAALVREYRAGASLIGLARRYRTSPAAVRRRLQLAAEPIRLAGQGCRAVSAVDARRVIAEYQDGSTGPEISRATGISEARVYACLHRARIKVHHQGRRCRADRQYDGPKFKVAQRRQLIEALRTSDGSLRSIASRFGTTHQYCSLLCRQFKIRSRHRSRRRKEAGTLSPRSVRVS